MSIRINEALRSGFRRTISREALGLIAVLLVFQTASTVIGQSFNNQLFGQFIGSTEQVPATSLGTVFGESQPFVFDLPLAVLAFGLILTAFVAEALSILGVRMFARDTTAPVSRPVLRDGLVLATLNGVVGGTIAIVAASIGAVLLVVPGLFIATSLFFVRQEIAVERKNFIDALTGSWELTRGVRLKTFGLVALLYIITLLAGSPAAVLFFLDPVVGTVLGVVGGSIGTVFGIAVATRAYVQLTEETTPPTDSDVGSEYSERMSTVE
jgi:hypothetical protein